MHHLPHFCQCSDCLSIVNLKPDRFAGLLAVIKVVPVTSVAVRGFVLRVFYEYTSFLYPTLIVRRETAPIRSNRVSRLFSEL